jgi:hypothetical protein
MHALPALRCSAAALMRWVGFKAHQGRQGVCPRGAATRQGPRPEGPIGPDTSADHRVQVNRRAVAALFNGVMRALATMGVLAAKVTGSVAATALETTAPEAGCGHGPRKRRITDTRGHVPASEVTVDGWQLIVLMAAATKRPLAGNVGPIPAHEVLSRRALVTQARTPLAGQARLHQGVCDQGFGDGPDLWWLEQHALLVGVPAKANMAVTVDAQAQAAAGAGVTVGRRGQTVRPGPGTTASTERLATAVGGGPD